ncbi:uncharacterized protein V1516DRAFT_713126 [Lipomyces oligophaga]|uniref:uncharacterized protein n=1 Tax=Lipomyces oligophaga TaxID=45792 RepID=UPI0034CE53A6
MADPSSRTKPPGSARPALTVTASGHEIPTIGDTIPPTPTNDSTSDNSMPSTSAKSSSPRDTSDDRQYIPRERQSRPSALQLRSSMSPRSRSTSRERGVSPAGARSPLMRVHFPEDTPSSPPVKPSSKTKPSRRLPPTGETNTSRAVLHEEDETHGHNPSAISAVYSSPGLEIADPLLNFEDPETRKRRYRLANSGAHSAPNSAPGTPDREPPMFLFGSPADDKHSSDTPTPPRSNDQSHGDEPLDLEKLNRKLSPVAVTVAPESELAPSAAQEAASLVRSHTVKLSDAFRGGDQDQLQPTFMVDADPIPSGMQTPVEHEDYVPPPTQVKGGILSALLKLYNEPTNNQSARTSTDALSTSRPLESGRTTPTRKWYSRSANASTSSLVNLVPKPFHGLPTTPSRENFGASTPGKRMGKRRSARADQIRITVHIADILQRQRFILKLCRALMLYGAPTHRLEEYMKMTSRVLEIDGQFLYIPGCMIVSFGDSSTHTSEMQLVRCVQGVDLGRLHITHNIYKEVVHDVIGVEEAMQRLDEAMKAKNLYHPYFCVLVCGFSSAMVAPFAFGGRWIDMPLAFVLGSTVGFLQLIVAPRSDLYSNVFEITASVIVSFVARAFGSINDKELFCFAAIAQGALALILPGYTILCGALELQSKNIVAGSVRMFYAIIYSLFLGFGITLGAAIYGWMDHNATSRTTCPSSLSPWFRFIFVPFFTLGLALVNQAHWRQIPVMVIIAGAGYVVSYFANLHFSEASEISAAIGAFVIGVLGNLYSRVGHGLAFAAMLPAIFVQVPSGLASQGSLVSGVAVADLIVSDSNVTEIAVTTTFTTGSVVSTTITTIVSTITSTTTSTSNSSSQSTQGIWAVGLTMIEISVGIVVGLFISTLAIYPFGKKRSGLFTF